MPGSIVRHSLPAALFRVSMVLLGLQLLDVAVWFFAVAASGPASQPDAVNYYLSLLPFQLGQLGAFTLTWVSITCGGLGCVAALIAHPFPVDSARAMTGRLAGFNALMAFWHLFSLM